MPKGSKIKISSNRSFGIVFFIVFLVVGLWPLIHEDTIRIWSIVVALIFLVLGLMKSRYLTPLNKLWMKFGMLLGTIIAPVAMMLVFFLVVTPTGIIMRMLGKDLLRKKYDKDIKSYWIIRDKFIIKMKQQF